METDLSEQLRELEEQANRELKVVNNYKQEITTNNIEPLRKYFAKRKDIRLKIESKQEILELGKKHYVIFSKVNGDE